MWVLRDGSAEDASRIVVAMAHLVACMTCRAGISSAAPVCPHCGHPQRRPKPKSHAGLLLIVFLPVVVVGAIVIGPRIKEQLEQERRQRELYGSPPEGASTEAAIDVSSDQLHQDYVANEIRADALYRGKLLRVTGAVQAIRKDFLGHPYVVLWTTNEFEGVHARFDDDGGLASLTPGAHVTIRCIGDNVVMHSPVLRRCTLEQAR